MIYKKYFLFGLSLFYLVIFFSPNKLISFAAYFVSTFFFYLATRNIKQSLFYSLILSLFSDLSIARSWFLMEPKELLLDSGYWISPTTILILCALPFSLLRKQGLVKSCDIVVLLFFLWNIVILIIYPYINVLYGLVSLSEILLLYYILRLYISKDNLRSIFYIIISILFFQTFIGLLQLTFQRPIGLTTEVVIGSSPYGVTASENENLFRLTGTFGHPNFFASFLLISLPFLFFSPVKNKLFTIFKSLSLIALFFTYSRAAWGIILFLFILWLASHKNIFNKINQFSIKKIYFPIILSTILFFVLSTLLFVRLDTLSQAFTDFGSFGVRNKLFQEGWNLLIQYPLTGVGLNRSLELYAASPITDIFTYTQPSSFYKIHNTFLEIAAETGFPGIILFSLFIYSILIYYLKLKQKSYVKTAAFYGFLGLILISSFNPFFHTSQFRLFFLLAAIILT